MKRPAVVTDSKEANEKKGMIRKFYESSLSVKGLKVSETNLAEAQKAGGEEEYKAYCENFVKLIRKSEHGMNDVERKTLSVGADPQGGYLVPPEMSSRIIQRLFELDPIRQLATVETISTDALLFVSDWNDFSAGWVGETQSRPETDSANLGMEKIVAQEMYAKPHASQQLLEDSTLDIEAWISRKLTDRFGRLEGTAFVTGDGVEKPRGILTYTSGTAKGEIEQVNMGNASLLTADGFYDVKYTMKEQFIELGTWLLNRTTVQAALKLKDGEGRYIWEPSFQAGQPATILGAPTRMSTSVPAVAANALSVVYADFRQAYTIVDRLGITIMRDPFSSKPLVEFYSRKRTGGGVVNWDAIKIGVIAV